jgi:4-methyl-5(b-hydroxyethyl)-thiazole monophosphate biosynthesis
MSKTALILIANGSEEIEAVTPGDVLVRAGVNVTYAGVGTTEPRGSHGIPLRAEMLVEDVGGILFDALILPGGAVGAENLHNNAKVNDLVKEHFKEGKIVAAICAAPADVLAPLGILNGKHAACYPGKQRAFPPDAKYLESRVVVDGNVVTGRAAGTSLDFALKIAELLTDRQTAHRIAEQMSFEHFV